MYVFSIHVSHQQQKTTQEETSSAQLSFYFTGFNDNLFWINYEAGFTWKKKLWYSFWLATKLSQQTFERRCIQYGIGFQSKTGHHNYGSQFIRQMKMAATSSIWKVATFSSKICAQELFSLNKSFNYILNRATRFAFYCSHTSSLAFFDPWCTISVLTAQSKLYPYSFYQFIKRIWETKWPSPSCTLVFILTSKKRYF